MLVLNNFNALYPTIVSKYTVEYFSEHVPSYIPTEKATKELINKYFKIYDTRRENGQKVNIYRSTNSDSRNMYIYLYQQFVPEIPAYILRHRLAGGSGIMV